MRPAAGAVHALPEEERAGKYVVSLLTHSNYPEFTEEYQKIIDRAMRESEELQ
jgi:hypothetical protein